MELPVPLPICTPFPARLKAITLPVPAVRPPIVFPEALSMKMPSWALGSSEVRAAFRPTRLL